MKYDIILLQKKNTKTRINRKLSTSLSATGKGINAKKHQDTEDVIFSVSQCFFIDLISDGTGGFR